MSLGRINFLSHAVESSLFRNGKVGLKRDRDGSDAAVMGVDKSVHDIEVIDGRALNGRERKTCEFNGFELVTTPMADTSLDFFDHQTVVTRYYEECERLVSQFTGGRALAFDHNVRSARGKSSQQRISGGQAVQGPAKIVHGDYTLHSGPARLRDLARPPGANDTLRSLLPSGMGLIDDSMVTEALSEGGRFAIINVWRNISDLPVQVNPMALCDAQSVDPDDLVTFEIHYQDRVGENYFAKHNPAQRFYFFPEMTRAEALLLKQWDSAGPLARSKGQVADASDANAPCTFSFHSAFDELSVAPDAPDRLSIEVRCLVLYR